MIEYSDNSYMLVSVACLAGFLEGKGKIEIYDDMQLTEDCIDIINKFDQLVDEITHGRPSSPRGRDGYPDWEKFTAQELIRRYGKV